MKTRATSSKRAAIASVLVLGCGTTVGASGGTGVDAGSSDVRGEAAIPIDRGIDAQRPDVGVDAAVIGLAPWAIRCGGAVCSRGDVCVACVGEPLRCYPRDAEPTRRTDCQFRAYCDTDDDCAAGQECLWIEGDFETFRCDVHTRENCRISQRCNSDAECAPCFGQPQRCVDPLAGHALGRGVFPRVCRR